jgi:hypothetical protein
VPSILSNPARSGRGLADVLHGLRLSGILLIFPILLLPSAVRAAPAPAAFVAEALSRSEAQLDYLEAELGFERLIG